MNFGRLEKSAGHPPLSEINVTPLVDVMLVLLVIFILATPLMASRLALNLPQAAASPPPSPEPAAAVRLALDAQGRLYWNEQAIAPESLAQRLLQTAQRNPATELQLHADAVVPYGRVVQIIGQAQQAGLSRIGFVAEPPSAAASAAR